MSSLLVAAARFRLRVSRSSEFPEFAVQALLAGSDGDALRELAGEVHPTWRDTAPLMERAVAETGLVLASDADARMILFRRHAEKIVAKAIPPSAALEAIWQEVCGGDYGSNGWEDVDGEEFENCRFEYHREGTSDGLDERVRNLAGEWLERHPTPGSGTPSPVTPP